MTMNCPKCKKTMQEGETFEDPDGTICTEYYCNKCRKHYTDISLVMASQDELMEEEKEVEYVLN